MPTQHILRVRRTDQPSDEAFILINATQNGPAALDLQLLGTDGEAPFVAVVSQKNINGLRAANYRGSDSEWSDTLAFALLQKDESNAIRDVELVATVDDQITLVIRKNISGITQRLGEIKLSQDEDQEIQLFEWTGLAALHANDLRTRLHDLQTSVHAQQDIVAKLSAELDDLVKAKKEHENELLQKFAELLNTKKLKIRDQQRLLSDAKVDPKTAAQIQSARASAGKRKAGASGAGKRKANGATMDTEDDVEDRIGVDDRNVDDDDEEIAKQMRDAETPEKSDLDETEDEDSSEDGFALAPVSSQAPRGGVGNKGKAIETVQARRKTPEPQPEPESEGIEPPPRRELPFGRRNLQRAGFLPKKPSPPAANQSQTGINEDEDEETDDEL